MTTLHRHQWVTDDYVTYTCDTPECPATATACQSPVRRGGGTEPCGRVLETVGRTCEPCVSRARNDLRGVRDLYRQLPDVIAAAAGLHAIRYDRTGGTRGDDTQIVGGDAFVMAAGGTADKTRLGRRETTIDPALLDAERRDPPSILAVLTFWEDAWRQEQHQHAATVTGVDAATTYLVVHVQWAAQHSATWGDFLTDLAVLRARLRTLTGAAQGPVRAAVPCPYDGGTVHRQWTDRGLTDTRRCDRCGITWESEGRFMLAILEAHQALPVTHPDELVTLEDARRVFKPRGVQAATLRQWVHRGVLVVRGQDARGRDLFRLGDIADRVGRGA